MKKKIISIIAILSIVTLSVLGIRNTYKKLIYKDDYKTCQKDLSSLQESCDATVEELEKEKAALEKQVEELNKKINSQKDTITKLEKENANLKKKLNSSSTGKATGDYKLTSYCSVGKGCNSGKCTGSGKCIKDFSTNELGWYTYKGKVVLATATPYLLNRGWAKRSGITYYKYNDTLDFVYKGKTYHGIVLDSCGACMKSKIIDVFVKDRASVVTSRIQIK
jgi:uncharacterized coiled-coil protein SlyX